MYIYIWSGVWRSQPPPPMVWSGTGLGGGGGGEGWGPLELQLEKRPGITDKASIVRKPLSPTQAINPITQRGSACSCFY